MSTNSNSNMVPSGLAGGAAGMLSGNNDKLKSDKYQFNESLTPSGTAGASGSNQVGSTGYTYSPSSTF